MLAELSEVSMTDPISPFSAHQIRQASPAGRRYVFRVDAVGEEPSWSRTTFVEADERGALLRIETWDLTRGPSVSGETRQTWEELRAHASYSASLTEVTHGHHDSPVGPAKTSTYTTRTEQGAMRGRAVFAVERPGPPLLVEIHGAAGVVRRLTLEADDMP